MVKFGATLQTLMKKEGVTRKQLSAKAKVAETTLRSCLVETRNPSFNVANKLVNALGYKFVLRKIDSEEIRKNLEQKYIDKMILEDNREDILCEFLRDIGYNDLVDAYEFAKNTDSFIEQS